MTSLRGRGRVFIGDSERWVFHLCQAEVQKNTQILNPLDGYEEYIMKIIRLKEVMGLTGLARSTVYKYVKEGQFPKQVCLGARSVGWVESEIQDWIRSVIVQRDEAVSD